MIALLCSVVAIAELPKDARAIRIRDVSDLEGMRDNPLIGYGMVVGLNGTGDRRQTQFTTQTLASIMQRMGVQIPATAVRVNNVAAVFVTASLPPLARPGTRVDVTVSSIGDAKSLEGGLLLLTPLHGADGQVYAAAQGALTLGGYSATAGASAKQVNHPTVGRIPAGGRVEREAPDDVSGASVLTLLLREADFGAARNIADAINREFANDIATSLDGRRVRLQVPERGAGSVPALMARIEELIVTVPHSARVVVNERTGTVVMGTDVKLGAVSILHGTLAIDISTEFHASQPEGFSRGETVVVPQTTLRSQESAVRRIELAEGASVEQLVKGLQTIGATARDVVAILQALHAAGALKAELTIL